jgi:hypothetical protein
MFSRLDQLFSHCIMVVTGDLNSNLRQNRGHELHLPTSLAVHVTVLK